MIYNFSIRNEDGKDKQICLTADSLSKLYHRIALQYGVAKDYVTILEEYDDTSSDWDKLILKKSYIKNDDQKMTDAIKQGRDLFRNSPKRCEPYKTDYMNKYGFNLIQDVNEQDVINLILSAKYKKIKTYWELGEKRGQHIYYALVK